jgi:hypothetical protein
MKILKAEIPDKIRGQRQFTVIIDDYIMPAGDYRLLEMLEKERIYQKYKDMETNLPSKKDYEEANVTIWSQDILGGIPTTKEIPKSQCCGGVNKPENQRKYLPTFAELVDRLSIVTLKSIFIPSNKAAYDQEAKDIMYDIDLLINQKGLELNAESIRAIQVIQLANRYIWENESKVRADGVQDYSLLKVTHSINGVRNTAKNVLSHQLGERKDLKVDCLAAELKSDLQNWDIFN